MAKTKSIEALGSAIAAKVRGGPVRASRSLRKPVLQTGAVLKFAEGRQVPAGKSGQIPTGDVRLTANIRGDLHLKLKIRAAEQRTTVGELIEHWIESWK